MPRPKKTAKRAFCIAICIDTREGPARERLAAIYRASSAYPWQLILVRHEDELNYRLLRGGRFDGAITFDRSEALHRMLRRNRVICVESAATHLAMADAAVFIDDDAIGRAAAEHLASAGFENCAYVGLKGAAVSDQRGESLRRHATRLKVESDRVFHDSVADGHAELDPLVAWLRRAPRPLGVLAFDDRMAMRVMAAARVVGLRIPDELGVLGIGNDDLLCELTEPSLSSIAVPTREVGVRATDMLAALLEKKSLKERRVALPPLDVITRMSTDRLAGDDPLVSGAIAFFRTNAHLSVGMEQVSTALGSTRRTLERRFYNVTGKTLHQYLTELRLRRATHRLRHFNLPLSEVAHDCGYSALSAFVRMFEKETGLHPHAYRRRHAAR